MRVKYGALIDYEIEKVENRTIRFFVHAQHPDTVAKRYDTPTRLMRQKFYIEFNDSCGPLSIDSSSFPAIEGSCIYLLGSSRSISPQERHYGTQAGRDEAYDQVVATLKAWSEFAPCRVLWKAENKQKQLVLL